MKTLYLIVAFTNATRSTDGSSVFCLHFPDLCVGVSKTKIEDPSSASVFDLWFPNTHTKVWKKKIKDQRFVLGLLSSIFDFRSRVFVFQTPQSGYHIDPGLRSCVGATPHHPSTHSYEHIRFLQTCQKRLINIHCKSLKHNQSALFGFGKNIENDQIWYENFVVFNDCSW